MRPNELQNILKYGVFISHVNHFRDPPLKCDRIFALGAYDSDADFRCYLVVGPIERDRGYGIPGKATACLLPERYLVAFLQSHGARSLVN